MQELRKTVTTIHQLERPENLHHTRWCTVIPFPDHLSAQGDQLVIRCISHPISEEASPSTGSEYSDNVFFDCPKCVGYHLMNRFHATFACIRSYEQVLPRSRQLYPHLDAVLCMYNRLIISKKSNKGNEHLVEARLIEIHQIPYCPRSPGEKRLDDHIVTWILSVPWCLHFYVGKDFHLSTNRPASEFFRWDYIHLQP